MVLARIIDWGRRFPSRVAIIENDRSVTYAAFAEMILGSREQFLRQRLAPKGLVALVGTRQLTAWVNSLALRMLGLDVVCLDSFSQLGSLSVRPYACIVPTRSRWFLIHWLRLALKGVRLMAAPTEYRLGQGVTGVVELPKVSHYGDQILRSSGTTGMPKLVRFSGAFEERLADHIIGQFDFSEKTVLNFNSLPVWTGFGGKFPIAIWAAGGTAIFDRRPDRMQRIFDHGANAAFVGVVDIKLLEKARARAAQVSPGFQLYAGGGVISAGDVELLRSFENCIPWFGLGSTELVGWSLKADLRTTDDQYPCWLEPCAERSVEVVNDNDEASPVGERGVMRMGLKEYDSPGYLGDAATTARNFRNGFFYTGDIAVRNAEGKVRVLGRAGDVLIIKGIKLPVGPFEADVRRICRIDNVCLFADLGDGGREQIVVVVEGDSLPEEEMRVQVAALFPGIESIRWEAVSVFPRTSEGLRKIRRTALHELVVRH